MLRAAQLYPRTREAPERRDLMRLEERLGDDVPFMLATGTSFAILYTALVREVLGVPAYGGFGYSLGESSMLFATGGWDPAGRSDALISDSPVFQDRLCGPRRTVRELWGLPDETPDESVWASHVLLSPDAPVREALTRYDRVHLTHVNTPQELVIAGDPAPCRALIEELGCRAARSPVNVVMHCPVVDAEFDGLARLNDYLTGSFGDMELFSAYDYLPLPAERLGEAPRRIATTLRSTIGFPRLVHAAYERGYRYFIEVGPGATCSRWIRETLGDAPHVAACVDRRGVPATTPLAHLAARLVGHGLPVDLTALLGRVPAGSPTASPAVRRLPTVRVGQGEPVPDRIAREAAAALPAGRAEGAGAAVSARAAGTVGAAAADGTAGTAAAADAAGTAEPAAPAHSARETATAPSTRRPAPAVPHAVPHAAPRTTAGTAPPARRTHPAGPTRSADPVRRTDPARPSRSAHPAVPAPVLSVPPEEPAALPADPTLEVSEVITFDGDPITALPWGTPRSVPADTSAPLPTGPVTRVTERDAKPGVLGPSRITTEYDVPEDPWYAVDGGVPPAVTVESGQCDLLLVSYLGIDFRNKGERVYRLLDGSLIFHLGSIGTRCEELRSRLDRDFGQCAELFDLAKEYCVVHAAAACVLAFVHSHGALEEPLPSGALLLLQLERLRRQLRPHEAVTDQGVVDEAMRVLRHLHREDRLFSYWQFPLAPRTADRAAARQ